MADRAFLTTAAHRMALLDAMNVNENYKEVFTGRATIASQAYPAHMMPAGSAVQKIPYSTSALTSLVKTLPASQRTLTIGYDSSAPDNQLVANLLSAELSPTGLNDAGRKDRLLVQPGKPERLHGGAAVAEGCRGGPRGHEPEFAQPGRPVRRLTPTGGSPPEDIWRAPAGRPGW